MSLDWEQKRKIWNQEPLMIQKVRTVQKTEAFRPSSTSIRTKWISDFRNAM